MSIHTQEHWGRSWCRVEAMLAAAKPVAEGRAALFSGAPPCVHISTYKVPVACRRLRRCCGGSQPALGLESAGRGLSHLRP